MNMMQPIQPQLQDGSLVFDPCLIVAHSAKRNLHMTDYAKGLSLTGDNPIWFSNNDIAYRRIIVALEDFNAVACCDYQYFRQINFFLGVKLYGQTGLLSYEPRQDGMTKTTKQLPDEANTRTVSFIENGQSAVFYDQIDADAPHARKEIECFIGNSTSIREEGFHHPHAKQIRIYHAR